MESLSSWLKNQRWNFIHLKIHRTKRAFLRSLYSLCLALNRLGIHPINISNQWWVRFGSCLNGTRIGPNHLSGYCSLVLFLQSNGVRHRFLKRINSFDCMIDFPEKHWRACKRGALPNWAIALVFVIPILSYYVDNFLSRWILHDPTSYLFDLFDWYCLEVILHL